MFNRSESDVWMKRILKLIKDDIFYDDDLRTWVESHNFTGLVDIAKGTGKLYMWYQDKETMDMTLDVLDLDILEMYHFKFDELSTII